MSRHQWYFNLPVGWYKLTIQERGFLSTLYSTGMTFAGDWDDVDALFGQGWKTTADALAKKRVIEMNTPSFGRFEMKILTVRKRGTKA
jgi:hypothetical protein